MIALNGPMTGNMGGVSGIDHQCWKQSKNAGLRGTFRAFLSSYAQSIKSIVRRRDRDLPLANRNVSHRSHHYQLFVGKFYVL